MGSVEVTSIDPVKLVRSNRVRHAVRGVAVRVTVSYLTLGSTSPAVSLAVKVTRAAVAEGLA